MGPLVRGCGILVVLFSLIILYQVVQTAWSLFKDHSVIVTFADEINVHTGLDDAINGVLGSRDFERLFGNGQVSISIKKKSAQEPTPEQADEEAPESPQESSIKAPQKPKKVISVTYFIAWLLGLMLLGLIARIGLWTMKTGASMALNGSDQQSELKALLAQILYERSRSEDPIVKDRIG